MCYINHARQGMEWIRSETESVLIPSRKGRKKHQISFFLQAFLWFSCFVFFFQTYLLKIAFFSSSKTTSFFLKSLYVSFKARSQCKYFINRSTLYEFLRCQNTDFQGSCSFHQHSLHFDVFFSEIPENFTNNFSEKQFSVVRRSFFENSSLIKPFVEKL